MNQQNWDVTLHTKPQCGTDLGNSQSSGCLVKIHPMELDNKMVRLNRAETWLGRDPASNIFCDDPSISRRHALIKRTRDGFVFSDCNSTNGSWVDGKTIHECQLEDGSRIRIGNHIFKFLADDSVESQYHETVYSMMTKDGLTGVFNKRYMADVLEREFGQSKAYGRRFSFIMMDIDFFKQFNDTYGHLAGDEVLQQFAGRIENICSTGQTFARFGGEEFALILAETDLESAARFAETARRVIADQPFDCCVGSLPVQASFGVAEVDYQSQNDYPDLIELADQRLYKAKNSGRNRVCFE